MKFKPQNVKMKELRVAETSNSAAMELMAKYAVDEQGEPLPMEEAMAQLDEMDMTQFFEAWLDFARAGLPNMSGRRS